MNKDSRRHEDTFAEFSEGQVLFKAIHRGASNPSPFEFVSWEVIHVVPGREMVLRRDLGRGRSHDLATLNAASCSRSHLPPVDQLPNLKWSCGYYATKDEAVDALLDAARNEVKDRRQSLEYAIENLSELRASAKIYRRVSAPVDPSEWVPRTEYELAMRERNDALAAQIATDQARTKREAALVEERDILLDLVSKLSGHSKAMVKMATSDEEGADDA